MDIEKFTRKSQEALSKANSIAVELNHQELVPLHLVLALIRQQDGLIPSVLDRMGIQPVNADEAAMELLRKIPAVAMGIKHSCPVLTAVLNEAQRLASEMKDRVCECEHLF